MMGGTKPSWRLLQVCGVSARGELCTLDGADRLVALYRFQNRERVDDQLFRRVDGREELVVDPSAIDWDAFPVVAALEAVTRDEVRRLRGLLASDRASRWGTR